MASTPAVAVEEAAGAGIDLNSVEEERGRSGAVDPVVGKDGDSAQLVTGVVGEGDRSVDLDAVAVADADADVTDLGSEAGGNDGRHCVDGDLRAAIDSYGTEKAVENDVEMIDTDMVTKSKLESQVEEKPSGGIDSANDLLGGDNTVSVCLEGEKSDSVPLDGTSEPAEGSSLPEDPEKIEPQVEEQPGGERNSVDDLSGHGNTDFMDVDGGQSDPVHVGRACEPAQANLVAETLENTEPQLVEKTDEERNSNDDLFDQGNTDSVHMEGSRSDSAKQDNEADECNKNDAEAIAKDVCSPKREQDSTDSKAVSIDVECNGAETTSKVLLDVTNSGESSGRLDATAFEGDNVGMSVIIEVSSQREAIEKRIPSAEVAQLVENDPTIEDLADENLKSVNLGVAGGEQTFLEAAEIADGSKLVEVGKLHASELELVSDVQNTQGHSHDILDISGPTSAETRLNEKVVDAVQESGEIGKDFNSICYEIKACDGPSLEAEAGLPQLINKQSVSLGSGDAMEQNYTLLEKELLPLDSREASKDINEKTIVDGTVDDFHVKDRTTESNKLVQEHEQLEELGKLDGVDKLEEQEMKAAKDAAVSPGAAVEQEAHSTSYLSRKAANEFEVSDLVWGKVKSHPWWPGQIFDASDASDLALKYQKKDAFLIGYFGDKTFAWCDESQLKHFEVYFSQMEKQSNSDLFVNALNGALEEVSRRTELAMICSCLPEEATSSISYQRVDNAGVRKGNPGYIVGNEIFADCLEPKRILEFVKTVACFPSGGTNRLELVKTTAQLKAFYKSKGYLTLPSFHISGALIEEDEDKIVEKEDIKHLTPNSTGSKVGKQKLKGRPSLLSKQKNALGDEEKDERLIDLIDVKTVSQIAGERKTKIDAKLSGELFSVSSGKRHKTADSDSSDSGMSKKKKFDTVVNKETKFPSPTFSSFKVGECIRRVASQLTKTPPILKSVSENSQKNVNKDDDIFDVFTNETSDTIDPEAKPMAEGKEDLIPADILSELCLVACNPTAASASASDITTFLNEFRNFTVSTATEVKSKVGNKRGRKKKVNVQPSPSDELAVDHMQDAYWSDMISRNNSSNDIRKKGEAKIQSQRKKRKTAGQMSPALAAPELQGGEQPQVGLTSPNTKLSPRMDRHIIRVEEKMVNECTPTALILNFNRSKPLPSGTDLIRIFSRYGPLKEAATDIQKKKNRVKVVFKKRADAEVAFSSAGKYSVFGPSLLSYQLQYLTSMPETPSDKELDEGDDDMLFDIKSPGVPVQADYGVLPDTEQIEVTQESVNSIHGFDEKNNDLHIDDSNLLNPEQAHEGALLDTEKLVTLPIESDESAEKLDVQNGDMVVSASDFLIPAQTYEGDVLNAKEGEAISQESCESILKSDEQNDDMHIDPKTSLIRAQVQEGVLVTETTEVVTPESAESIQKLNGQSHGMLDGADTAVLHPQEPVESVQNLDEQSHSMISGPNDSVIPEAHQSVGIIQNFDEQPAQPGGAATGTTQIELVTQEFVESAQNMNDQNG